MFWLSVVVATVNLFLVFSGRIFRLIPVISCIAVAIILLIVISLLTTKEGSWFETGTKSIADNVFPTLRTSLLTAIGKIKGSVTGLFGSVFGSIRSIF